MTSIHRRKTLSSLGPSYPADHLGSVDLLRGLAILGVVTVHTSYCWFAEIPSSLRLLFRLGRYGVDLFFIVSAFTLFRTCKNRTMGEFVLRRWLRIAPVYYLGIFIYSVLPWLLGESKPPQLGILVANLTFLNAWWPGQSSIIVPGGWSISAEVAFYCLLPWAAKVIVSFRHAVLAYGLVLLTTQLVGFWAAAQLTAMGVEQSAITDFMEYCPIWHLPTFSLGLVLYFARPFVSRKLGWLCVFLGPVVFLFTPYTIGQWHLPRSFAVGGALFIFSLGVTTVTDNLMLFPFKWLRWLGTVSYGIYLMHFGVLEVLVVIIIAGMFPAGFPGFCMFATSLIGTILLSSILAALNHRYLERPALSLAAKLSS